MATERLPVRKIKEILRMKWALGLSHRAIARSRRVSPGVVSHVASRVKAAGITWEEASGLPEEVIEARLYVKPVVANSAKRERRLPDFAELHAERLKPGDPRAAAHRVSGAPSGRVRAISERRHAL